MGSNPLARKTDSDQPGLNCRLDGILLRRFPWDDRYEHPGKFNPDTFDVYSIHGNSKNSSLWIGNWPNPFHIRGALEAEQIEIESGNENVAVSKQKIGIASFPPLSGG